MKDRFKFRIWDEDNKCFDYINLLEDLDNTINKLDSLCDYFHKKYIAENPQYIQQCTGLKDKNGKLIFEGDILKETKINWDKTEYYKVGCVFWDRTQFQLGYNKATKRGRVQTNKRLDRLVEPKCKFAFCDYTPIKDFVNAEVIGNIYENPELFKEVKGE